MGNELQTTSSGALTVGELNKRVKTVHQAMKSVMRKDTHYGIIPGCQKPTLFKPGSELLLSMFRIAVIPRVEDLGIAGEVHYRVTCKGVLPNGDVVGEGIGECSSEEEKYKWRSAQCAEEFDVTDDERKRLKFLRDGKKIKQVRMNPADVANTILKMAKKRAQMDLTLTCTGASDVFTADVEDLPPEVVEAIVKEESVKKAEATAERTASVKSAPPVSKDQNQPEDADVTGEMSISEQIDLALNHLTGGDEAAMKNLLLEASRGGKSTGYFLTYAKLHLPETSKPWLHKIMEYLQAKIQAAGDDTPPFEGE